MFKGKSRPVMFSRMHTWRFCPDSCLYFCDKDNRCDPDVRTNVDRTWDESGPSVCILSRLQSHWKQQDGPRELPVRSLALLWDPTVSSLSATVSNPDKLTTAFHCGAKPQSQQLRTRRLRPQLKIGRVRLRRGGCVVRWARGAALVTTCCRRFSLEQTLNLCPQL